MADSDGLSAGRTRRDFFDKPLAIDAAQQVDALNMVGLREHVDRLATLELPSAFGEAPKITG